MSRRAILTMTRAKKIKTIIEMRAPPKTTKGTPQTQFLKLNISNNKTIFVSKKVCTNNYLPKLSMLLLDFIASIAGKTKLLLRTTSKRAVLSCQLPPQRAEGSKNSWKLT